MRRRGFIVLLGGAAMSGVIRRAQPATKRVVGFLNLTLPGQASQLDQALREGLAAAGYVEGPTLVVEGRYAEGRYDRIPALVEELMRLKAAVIVAGGNVAALAAAHATKQIPLVFIVGSDPVKLGLVASLRRPGGNATGIFVLTAPLTLKRLELIGELLPQRATLGFLANTDNADVQADLESAARASGRTVHAVTARGPSDFASAFTELAEMKVGALLVSNDASFLAERDRLVALAARHHLPAVYEWREYTEAGGLMSYGPSRIAMIRQAGVYAGRILSGADPRDLPVAQPTTFELVINLRTAKTLGLIVPPTLLARADEVIE